jgi:hypothetical protein
MTGCSGFAMIVIDHPHGNENLHAPLRLGGINEAI